MKNGNRNRVLLALATGLCLIAMVGCAKPPQSDIDAAKQAVQNAQAEASKNASDSLRAAQDTLSRLDAELKAQEEKFALFRKYDTATQLATQAKQQAEKAASDAAAAKERVKNEASNLMASVRASLDEAKTMLASAPRGKGTQLDLEAMNADLAAVEASLAEIDQAFNSGDYLEAKAKAESAAASVNSVKTEIQTAIEMKKAGGRR